MSRTLKGVSTAALIVVLILTGITALYCYYAAVVLGEVPKCAAREILDGYRTGILDIWGLPLFGLFVIFVVWRYRRGTRVVNILKDYDLPVFEFASMKITFGMVLVFSPLMIMVFGVGLVAVISAARHDAFTKCYVEQAVAPPSN